MRPVRSAVAVAAMMVAMASCANGSEGDASGAAGPASGGDITGDASTVTRAVEATAAVERARVEMQTAYTGLGDLSGVASRRVPTPSPDGGASGSAGSSGSSGSEAGGAPGSGGAGEVRVVQRAAFDRRGHRAVAEGDMSELAAVLATTDESVPGDHSLPTRFLIDGDSIYTQVGPLAPMVGLAATTWIRRDLDGFVDQSIENETAALLLEPLGMLGLLVRPITDVAVEGPDEVRGVATVHLTATVDLSVATAPWPSGDADGSVSDDGAAASDSDAAAAPGTLPGDMIEPQFRAIGVDELPVEVWVGDDHVIRRLRFSIDEGRSGGGTLTTTFDVYDVGEPIDIEVPAPADVVDQADLRSRLGP